MSYIGTKPANQITDSTLIADGTVTPADLSTGAPVWNTSGNVGIGITNPSSYNAAGRNLVIGTTSNADSGITVASGTTATGYLLFADGTSGSDAFTGYIGYNHGSNYMQFHTNGGSERMRIDASGNVGIGTTTINDRLVVQSSSAEQGITIRGDGLDAIKIGMVNPSVSNDGVIGMKINNALRFITNNTERMRITSGGAVCISSTESTFQLRSAGAASAHFGDAYDPGVYGCVQITRSGDQPDNRFHLAFIRNGFQVAGMGFLDNSSTFAIQNSFNTGGAGVTLGVNATSWGTTSDERKKNIIAPVENALTKLADWRSVYYKYKIDEADTPQRVGLIAQDVQATLPEAVSVEEDEIKTLQLRYTETIPLLVKAIQELKAELDATKAEVALLKSQGTE